MQGENERLQKELRSLRDLRGQEEERKPSHDLEEKARLVQVRNDLHGLKHLLTIMRRKWKISVIDCEKIRISWLSRYKKRSGRRKSSRR